MAGTEDANRGAGTPDLSVAGSDGSVDDSGNVLGGSAGNATAVAVGPTASTVADSAGSVAIGENATANRFDQVVIGRNASAEVNSWDSVVIGVGAASGSDEGAVVIGRDAVGGSSRSTAVGGESSATNSDATAVGFQANAEANGVAVGRLANSRNTGVAIGHRTTCGVNLSGPVAIGQDASVTHDGSIAIGQGVASTAADQVRFGARHVELGDVTTPAAPGAGNGRLAFRDNGGTQELVVVFANGAVKVLADDV